MKSTKAMRDRIRELMTDPIDDYDRAVLCVLDDLEHMLNEPQEAVRPPASLAEVDEALAAFGRAVTETAIQRPLRMEAENKVRDFLRTLRGRIAACSVTRPLEKAMDIAGVHPMDEGMRRTQEIMSRKKPSLEPTADEMEEWDHERQRLARDLEY